MPHHHTIERVLICEVGWFVVFANIHFISNALLLLIFLFEGRAHDL